MKSVFVKLPPGQADALRAMGWRFHDFIGASRLMCAWDTHPEDIDALVKDVEAVRTAKR